MRTSAGRHTTPSRPGSRALAATLVCVLVLATTTSARPQARSESASEASATEISRLLATGDAAFDRREDGATGGRARPEAIGDAVASFRKALEVAPDRIDVRVRLLRALFFQARYATPEPARQKGLFEEGRRVFEDGLERLEQAVGHRLDKVDPRDLPDLVREHGDAGELFFWGALHWGLWGESFGTMASVRRGVAGKIRRYGESALALVPEYENAGAYRLLGRLHALAPRVPLFTGWVDHDLAVEYLERAFELAPADPLNRLYLAEALFDLRPEQHARALQLLESAARAKPRPEHAIEDAEAIGDAARRLADLSSDRASGS